MTLSVTKNKKGKYLSILAVALFLYLAAVSQTLYDKVAPPFQTKTELARRDLLPAKLLPYVHFGFNVFLADMYWIRTIQDYVAWNGTEKFFIEYFRNISTLDPKFEHPYLFAIWTVPTAKNNLDALYDVEVIVKKGIEVIPSSWKIPYHLGTQFYLFTKSYDKAKGYLKIAAEKPDAPSGVYLNYSSFVINNVKGYKASYDLVKVIYDSTTDATLKKVLELGLENEMIKTMLERGILAYKTTTGKYPSSLDDLIRYDYVSLPSTFTSRFDVVINKNTGGFRIEERR